MSIGANIKKYRLKNGLTQKQLGDKCEMADSAIRRYELEKANPKIETLQKIASALNVSIADLDTRSNFSITYMEKEIQSLRENEMIEFKQLPDDEWFGDEWNRIHQKYQKRIDSIQKKINNLRETQYQTHEGELFSVGSGSRIKRIREEMGMTQQVLASLSDIPVSLLRKYEEGKRSLSYEHLFAIAKVFDVAVIDISPCYHMHIYPILEEDTMYNSLISSYNNLNKEGQKKAVEYIEILSKIPDYLENQN